MRKSTATVLERNGGRLATELVARHCGLKSVGRPELNEKPRWSLLPSGGTWTLLGLVSSCGDWDIFLFFLI